MGSGVNDCPCCGHAVMVANVETPELCDDCITEECNESGPSGACFGIDRIGLP